MLCCSLALASGCPKKGATPTTLDPEATAEVRHEPEPVAAPAAVEPEIAELEPEASDAVPAYAQLDYRADEHTTLRAKIQVVAQAYAPRSLTSLTEEVKRHDVLIPVPVLEEDADGVPRRPRVLCEEAKARLAIAVDADALQTVIRTQTFVAGTAAVPPSVTGETPGIRLAAGAKVGINAELANDITEIHYEGLFLVGDGFVGSKSVDVVYEPGVLDDDRDRDGRLVGDVTFYATPRGAVLGRAVRRGASNDLNVQTLGAPKDGHVLVRYQESHAFIVGWVKSAAVERYEPTTAQFGSGSMSGSGRASEPTIELPRGTLLSAPISREVIGVVTRDGSFVCGETCGDAAPRVLVRPCGHAMRVYATPPRASGERPSP